ncbi:MAG: endolytic transglycosylase MltG [Minisyncoccia bacterium]
MLRKNFETLKEKAFQVWGHRLFLLLAAIVGIFVILVLLYAQIFGPPSEESLRRDFVIAPDTTLGDIATTLEEEGYVRSSIAFRIAYEAVRGEDTLRPGGYSLAWSMDAWAVAKTLSAAPHLAWITIPPGLRKEEIAELLGEALGWTKETKTEWLSIHTELGEEWREGVYFPDTYLIPSDQAPADVAARLRGRFEEVFAPYAADAREKGIPWTEVITLASLIEKESAKKDKALVSGILWNRLKKGMLLQVDATLQYLAGTEEDWWPLPNPDDKYTESPFNTYQHAGLPPTPIANPSLASIEAALYPQKTACLYYLHDLYGRIHCSTNYRAHVANVHTYLR